MKSFFNEEVLLNSQPAIDLYKSVKDLPIIDYHCHLSQKMIKENAKFETLADLWLAGDHYKWRAMRLAGVDEKYITGDSTMYEKFEHYCEMMPKFFNNPLYYWSHFELKQIFGINLEINKENAKTIYDLANKKLKTLDVQSLLKFYNLEYIATTDDPIDDLADNGVYAGIKVSPTFRGDKLLTLDSEYFKKLGTAAGVKIVDLPTLKQALIIRLDYFIAHGCRICDHGFEDFPSNILNDEEANRAFLVKDNLDEKTRSGLVGNIFNFLLREYKKRNMIVQLHFAVVRNINTPMFKKLGPDHGFDVMSKEANINYLINMLDSISDEDRPTIVLYTLNPNTIAALACISGAYRNVLIGAAWWFNDTVSGIRNNLNLISEYAILGTNLGMLTDSRSFSSYSRFDFFRRLLCDFVGDKIEKGEYTMESGYQLVKDICYYNIKRLLGE